MGPVVTAVSTQNVPNGTAGQLEEGDTLTIQFSEPVYAPVAPASRLTLTPGTNGGNDMLQIPNIGVIDLGTAQAYISGSQSASFLFSIVPPPSGTSSIVITIGECDRGRCDRVTKSVTPATVTMTPSPAVQDGVGNSADGLFKSQAPEILF
jgi:hypothetical protein